MDKVEILRRLRNFIDEASEDFFNDDLDLYPALTLAQLEVAEVLADDWKKKELLSGTPVKIPTALLPLRKAFSSVIASGANSHAMTFEPLQVISVQWQSDGAVISATSPFAVEVEEGGNFGRIRQNPFLIDGTYFHWTQVLLRVFPFSTDASAGFEVIMIEVPTDITASVDPIIGETAHDAIVERACWILLKDRESDQAGTHLQLYTQLIQGLMV